MVDLLIDVPYLWLADGYGQTGANVIMALAEFCDRHGLTWGCTRTQIITKQPDRLTETKFIQDHLAPANTTAKVLFLYNYPKAQDTVTAWPSSEKHVCFTMFETDRCPSGWISLLNQYNLVLVPTPNQKDFFQSALQGTPVATLHIPLHKEYYHVLPDSKLLDTLPDKFTFSFVGTATNEDRKGIKELCKAFKESDIDANLKIRCRNWKPSPDPRIIVEDRELKTVAQMIDFYLGSHCGVYPSRGEGYGLPQIETSLLGRPVIVANNSAVSWTAQHMPWVLKMPCTLQPAEYHHPSIGDPGCWGYCNMDEALNMMHLIVHYNTGFCEFVKWAHRTNELRDILSPENIQHQLDTNLLPLF